jgi:hypothetical protein
MANGPSPAGGPASGPAPDGELLQERTAASISGRIFGHTHGFYLEYPRAQRARWFALVDLPAKVAQFYDLDDGHVMRSEMQPIPVDGLS